MNSAPENTLAIIIPAFNCSDTLPACLESIAASARTPDEILLFNDGSTDDTARIATEFGAKVINNTGAPRGPAVGRNICATESTSDTLVFIDSDVSVEPDSIGKLESAITSDVNVAAAFGSYDNQPASSRLAALYANLRHHFFHQTSAREATTFWSGFGAMQRDVFLANGGYCKSFDRPSIEDIELGIRVKQAGLRIRLVPEALAKHHKDWTIRQLWRTDIWQRAVPWAKLIVSGETGGVDLNVTGREKMKSVFAHLIWILALVSVLIPETRAVTLLLCAATAITYAAMNTAFYSVLFKAGGLRLLFGGAALHWLYHLYASVVFACVLTASRLNVKTPSQKLDRAS